MSSLLEYTRQIEATQSTSPGTANVESGEMASSRQHPKYPPSGRFRPHTLRELRNLPPPRWLVGGILEADSLAVLYGETGIGKSFVGIDLGLHVAMGLPWHGHPVRQGPVVYVYTEGANAVPVRVDAWCAEHGVEPNEDFTTVPAAPEITVETDLGDFVGDVWLACPKPALIVIDTLARTFGPGDENKQQDMNAYVRACDRLRTEFPGSTILVIHHTGKDASRGARGSTVLVSAFHTAIALTRSSSGVLEIDPWKHRNWQATSPMFFTLFAPDDETPPVLRPVEHGGRGRQPRRAERASQKDITDAVMLDALARLDGEGATFKELKVATGKAKDTVSSSLQRLVAAGRVEHIGRRYVAVPSGDGTSGPVGPIEDQTELDLERRAGSTVQSNPSP